MNDSIKSLSLKDLINFMEEVSYDQSYDFKRINNLFQNYVVDSGYNSNYKYCNPEFEKDLDINGYYIDNILAGVIMIDKYERRLKDIERRHIISYDLSIIYVKNEFRKKGIGKSLVEFIINKPIYKDIILQASILEGNHKFWNKIECIVKGTSFTSNKNKYAAYLGVNKHNLLSYSKTNPFGDRFAEQYSLLFYILFSSVSNKYLESYF